MTNRSAAPGLLVSAAGLPRAEILARLEPFPEGNEDDQGWTMVDFQTSAPLGGVVDRHRRQVVMYAWLVRRATGRDVRAVLMRA